MASITQLLEESKKLSRVGAAATYLVGAAATYLVGAAATYLGWVAGSSGNKTNSAFNWVEVEVEAELGNMAKTSNLKKLHIQKKFVSQKFGAPSCKLELARFSV